jgi:outer membrane lipoprotein LolB
MISRRRWLAAVCVVAGLSALAGCATPARIDQSASNAVFQRTGRFAVSVSYDDGRQQAVQGGFAWLDTGRMLTLDLANPLGSTLARVQVTPGLAVLTQTDGNQESAPSADALVERVLGSPIPVAGLRQWLRGIVAAPGDLHTNQEGKPERFNQSGWRVQLLRYDAQGPGLLRLNRNEAGRSISVRLVIDAS